MRKLLTLLGAVLLVFILVACEEVTPVEIDDTSVGNQGPSLNDLVGTWTGSEVATEIIATTVTDSDNTAATPGDITTSEASTTVSTWNYSLVIAEGTGDAAPTFTLTVTETINDPGLLVSNTTTSGTTTTTVSYGNVTQVNSGADVFATQAGIVLAPFDGDDFASSTGSAAAAFGADGLTDFGLDNTEASGLTAPTAVAISGNPRVVTIIGTVTETESYNTTLGRAVRAYAFAVSGVTQVDLATAEVRNPTTISPSVVFGTDTEVDDRDDFNVFPEFDFVRDLDENEWVLTDAGSFGFDGGLRLQS